MIERTHAESRPGPSFRRITRRRRASLVLKAVCESGRAGARLRPAGDWPLAAGQRQESDVAGSSALAAASRLLPVLASASPSSPAASSQRGAYVATSLLADPNHEHHVRRRLHRDVLAHSQIRGASLIAVEAPPTVRAIDSFRKSSCAVVEHGGVGVDLNLELDGFERAPARSGKSAPDDVALLVREQIRLRQASSRPPARRPTIGRRSDALPPAATAGVECIVAGETARRPRRRLQTQPGRQRGRRRHLQLVA